MVKGGRAAFIADWFVPLRENLLEFFGRFRFALLIYLPYFRLKGLEKSHSTVVNS